MGAPARCWIWRLGLRGLYAGMILTGGLMGAIYLLNDWPASLERVPVTCGAAPAPGKLRPGHRYRLLSWNLQYGASRRYHFFYDGGRDVYADWRVVQQTLAAMARVLRRTRPDLLLLQEVDRDSARTARIDELTVLRHALARPGGDGTKGPATAPLPIPCWASTRYHRSRYVPVPLHRPLGRVDMDLATGGRFQMLWALRRALPLLQEPPWRRAFNLKRAILEVALPVVGRARPLLLLNTHLSAFSHGDGTLARQVQVILARLAELDARSIPWILAGDFNALPPGDTPARLGAESHLYARGESPIAPLFRRYRSAEPMAGAPASATYTYQPYGAPGPDRRIDYVFASDSIVLHDFQVLRSPETQPLSDHLPLVLDWSLSEAP